MNSKEVHSLTITQPHKLSGAYARIVYVILRFKNLDYLLRPRDALLAQNRMFETMKFVNNL